AGLWTLAQTGQGWTIFTEGRPENPEDWGKILEDALRAKESAVRSWAVRLLAEEFPDSTKGDELLAEFNRTISNRILAGLQNAAKDSNSSVRLAAAVAVREIVSGSLTVDTELNT